MLKKYCISTMRSNNKPSKIKRIVLLFLSITLWLENLSTAKDLDYPKKKIQNIFLDYFKARNKKSHFDKNQISLAEETFFSAKYFHVGIYPTPRQMNERFVMLLLWHLKRTRGCSLTSSKGYAFKDYTDYRRPSEWDDAFSCPTVHRISRLIASLFTQRPRYAIAILCAVFACLPIVRVTTMPKINGVPW